MKVVGKSIQIQRIKNTFEVISNNIDLLMSSSKNISWNEERNLKVHFWPKVLIALKFYSGYKTFIIYFVKQCYYFKVLVYVFVKHWTSINI